MTSTPSSTHHPTYIDYQAGTIPLILSAPHGGTAKPDHLPNRHASQGSLKSDMRTRELTLELADELELILNDDASTNTKKHRVFVVSNHLHRSKVDVNRGALEEAVPFCFVEHENDNGETTSTRHDMNTSTAILAKTSNDSTNTNSTNRLLQKKKKEAHPESLNIYNEYHTCLQRACDAALNLKLTTTTTTSPTSSSTNKQQRQYSDTCTTHKLNKHRWPRALLLDIHGHAHPEGWIEIGHLIAKESLISSTKHNDDDDSDSELICCSENNIHFHPQLIRSKYSLGAFMNKQQQQVDYDANANAVHVDVVPSPNIPHPGDAGSYLMGGYITRWYRSTSRSLYSMQLELPPAVRMEDRCVSVRWLALAIVEFMRAWDIIL